MPLVNFRSVASRFGHIDGTFVSSRLGFPVSEPRYVLRFYPWWEHPDYLRARENDAPWGFADCEEGAREVAIYPRGLVAFRMSRNAVLTDCWFAESGPAIWPYEQAGQIFVNEPVDLDALASAAATHMGVGVADLRRAVDTPQSYAKTPPFSLRLPRSVLMGVMDALDDLGVAYYKAYVPKEESLPVAFIVDANNWIVADDFDVDFPEFEHRPEWFDASRYCTSDTSDE